MQRPRVPRTGPHPRLLDLQRDRIGKVRNATIRGQPLGVDAAAAA